MYIRTDGHLTTLDLSETKVTSLTWAPNSNNGQLWAKQTYYLQLLFIVNVCLLVIFRPIWEFLTHMETSPLKGCKFYLCLALMAIEQWGFFSVTHLMCQGQTFIMVISEDLWHTYCSVWSSHYLLLWLRSIAAGIRTPNLLFVWQTYIFTTILFPRRREWLFKVGWN